MVSALDLADARSALRRYLLDRVAGGAHEQDRAAVAPAAELAAAGDLGHLAMAAEQGGLAVGCLALREFARVRGALARAALPAVVAAPVLAAVQSDAPGLRGAVHVGITDTVERQAGRWCSGIVSGGGDVEALVIPVNGTAAVVHRPPGGWEVVETFEVDAFPGVAHARLAFSPDGIEPTAIDFATVVLREAPAHAAVLLGLTEAALEMTIEYVRTRVQFGRPIGEFGEIHGALAADHARTLAVGALLDRVVAADPLDPIGSLSVRHLASVTCREVTARCQHAHGGYGHMRDQPIGRLVRDARALSLFGAGDTSNDLRRLATRLGIRQEAP